MKSQFVLYGMAALVLPVGLGFLTGCQEAADPAAYQEFPDLETVKDKSADSSAENQVNEPSPAIAEKPDQPAVAEASSKRAERQAAVASSNPNGPKAKSRPGELVIANEGEKREIKLLVPEKRFTKASADGTLRVSYDDIDLLKVLNANPVPLDITDYFPEWLEGLEGQRIRIRGFMYPAYQETGLKGFILARDNDICCFGRDPKVYDLIRVVMREGTTTNYLPNRPFDVEGTFHIVPEPAGESLLMLYEIRDAQVITGR